MSTSLSLSPRQTQLYKRDVKEVCDLILNFKNIPVRYRHHAFFFNLALCLYFLLFPLDSISFSTKSHIICPINICISCIRGVSLTGISRSRSEYSAKLPPPSPVKEIVFAPMLEIGVGSPFRTNGRGWLVSQVGAAKRSSAVGRQHNDTIVACRKLIFPRVVTHARQGCGRYGPANQVRTADGADE